MSDTILQRRSRPHAGLLSEDFDVVLSPPGAEPLSPEIVAEVRRLVNADRSRSEVQLDGAMHVINVARLIGRRPFRYAVFVERRGGRLPLVAAYERFGLSAREAEVLALIVDGASNREIAEALSIVPATVQNHVRSLCEKANARRRGDLLARVFGIEQEERDVRS
jgi:DNA-binding CsgD family transcriptional regulator